MHLLMEAELHQHLKNTEAKYGKLNSSRVEIVSIGNEHAYLYMKSILHFPH